MTTYKNLISEEDRKALGEELLKWRLRVGKTQKQVAAENKMSRWTISRAETDAASVNMATAYKLFAYLARELRKEAAAYSQIDGYAVDKLVIRGKAEQDEILEPKYDGWEVDKQNA